MKSFSDNLPDVSKLVTKEQHEQFVSDLTKTLRNVRTWMFGLAALNVVLTTLVLVFTLHHH